MAFCNKCGRPLVPGAKFCAGCGASAVQGAQNGAYRQAPQQAQSAFQKGFQKGQQAFGGGRKAAAGVGKAAARSAAGAGAKAGAGVLTKAVIGVAATATVVYGGKALIDSFDDPGYDETRPGYEQIIPPGGGESGGIYNYNGQGGGTTTSGGGGGGGTTSSTDGLQYFLIQTYGYATDSSNPEKESEVLPVRIDNATGTVYMGDPDDPSDMIPIGTWDGSWLTITDGEESVHLHMTSNSSGAMSSGIVADDQAGYIRLTPVTPLGNGTYQVNETGETFTDEDDLEGGSIDTQFMSEVISYANANGYSMEYTNHSNNYQPYIPSGGFGGGGTGMILPSDENQQRQVIEYYIKLEGEKHINEFLANTSSNVDDAFRDKYKTIEHTHLPPTNVMTQSEFERAADDYAKKYGPSDYVPVESWK